MAQTLSEIKDLLATFGLHPKHRYGQNFLHDGNHMARILEAAAIAPDDRVLEVGPGTGALSERLLDAGARVLAVEIDTDLEPILESRVMTRTGGERFELLLGDILDGKHHLHPQVIERLGQTPFKLIANLPYHVASPLIINLMIDFPAMSQAVVMVQKEVADRLAARPGGKDYGALGIVVQALGQVRTVGTLSPHCFWPAPKIASAVVQIVRHAEPRTPDPHGFSALLQKLFGQRRKQLGAILGRDFPFPTGVDPQQRPEMLSVEQLIQLQAAQPTA